MGNGHSHDLYVEYANGGIGVEVTNVIKLYDVVDLAEIPSDHNYKVHSTYRCPGGAGPKECSMKTFGFQELVASGVDLHGAVFYSETVNDGFGKCPSVWNVLHCAMVVPERNTTDAIVMMSAVNGRCGVDVTGSDGASFYQFGEVGLRTKDLQIVFRRNCSAPTTVLMRDSQGKVRSTAHVEDLYAKAPIVKRGGHWVARQEGFTAHYSTKFESWIVRPVYPAEHYKEGDVYVDYHKTGRYALASRGLVDVEVDASMTFEKLRGSENCSKTQIVDFRSAVRARDGVFGILVEVELECILKCKHDRNVVIVKSKNKQVFLDDPHQSYVYVCETKPIPTLIRATRTLGKLSSAVVAPAETGKKSWDFEWHIPTWYAVLALAFLLYAVDSRTWPVALVVLFFGGFDAAEALTVTPNQMVMLVEITQMSMLFIGPLWFMIGMTVVMAIICVVKWNNHDYMTRFCVCMLVFPSGFRFGVKVMMVFFTAYVVVLFNERYFRNLEFRCGEGLKDIRGGESNEILILLDEMWGCAQRLARFGGARVYKSVGAFNINPIRYVQTMTAQAMYGSVKPEKFPSVLTKRKRNVRNMRGIIFYPVEFDVIKYTLNRLSERQIAELYNRGELVVNREMFDLAWLRDLGWKESFYDEMNACLEISLI